MSTAALRWGFLLVALLVLLALMGWRVQRLRQVEARLVKEKRALLAEKASLEAERARRTSPEALIRWAQEHGFVPLPEGAWR